MNTLRYELEQARKALQLAEERYRAAGQELADARTRMLEAEDEWFAAGRPD